ncbi:bifunctional (p)ppGpp synthetase/guanosine-3',5'-bis(diphosphate) 3'-pyrophosphohydrolase [Candidatus Parcubacteria bacterium]|nr:bifunctional (p)ppGpp synthetase/guanosine-3',5'-bis(diphosphate) 3'-pyrophosphohydrolase [Candidatus Parcubacteria bacterium]
MSTQKQKIVQKIIKGSVEPKLIQKAYQFAEKAHRNQKRASGDDFIIHPLETALCLKKIKLEPITIAAGLLHDVPDDTDVTDEEIKKEFGKEIAFLVEGVSKLGKIKYHGVERQAENFRKLFLAMAKDVRVILIKLCDRLHNLKTLNYLREDKAKRIALETIEIYAPLAYRLGIGEIKGRLEDAAFPIVYPNEYQQLISRVKDKYEERENYIEKIVPIVKKELKKEGVETIEIHSRAKHYYSLYQKLKRYNNDLDKIYDLVALRIIVKNVEECYKTLGVIHKIWKPFPGRTKDYISRPKPNGYRSLHSTVSCSDLLTNKCPNGLKSKIIEIQIRTPQMHREAEFGIAAHWYYSEQKGLKTYIKRLVSKPPERKLYWLKQLREWQEETKKFSPDRYLESLKIDFFGQRVFVFTPKGDIIDLPEKSCPVDFAYAIHTEVGNHCQEAKVNGKIARLNQGLNSGDLVEIITNKKRTPSRDWLDFVKTSLARIRIKKWFSPAEQLEKKTTLPKILSFIPIPVRKEKKLKEEKALKRGTVSLAGQKGMLTNIAKCCSPQPGDKIIGYITKNKGATIHRADCLNLKRTKEKWPQKIVKATWD